MRDLIYCGEWIESHVMHMFILHLPDFLGYESVISMAADHRETVKRALNIKKTGNDIITLLGGRSVHPLGMCVGGFYSSPDSRDVAALLSRVKVAPEEMVQRLADLPDQEAALRCERLIRNYDPYISCSVHFLKFNRTWGNGRSKIVFDDP